MSNDSTRDRLNREINKALSETEKWATLADQMDKRLRATPKESLDWDSVKIEHETAHKMACEYQERLEQLFAYRDTLGNESPTINNRDEQEALEVTLDEIEEDICAKNLAVAEAELARMEVAHLDIDSKLTDEEKQLRYEESVIALKEASEVKIKL